MGCCDGDRLLFAYFVITVGRTMRDYFSIHITIRSLMLMNAAITLTLIAHYPDHVWDGRGVNQRERDIGASQRG